MYGVLWSISICSPATDIASFSAPIIDRNLKKNGIHELQVYNGATHQAMRTPFPYISKILKRSARIITDKRPDFPDDFITREDD